MTEEGKRRGPGGRIEAAHLPEAIVLEILSWLPVKLLCRFKCVCTSWNLLISEGKLSLSPAGRERVIACGYRFTSKRRRIPAGEDWINFYTLEDELPVQKLPRPSGKVLSRKAVVYFLGNCNGLVLYVAFNRMYLWNPSTRRCRALPHLEDLVSRCINIKYQIISGLCYDESSHDYKVVVISNSERSDRIVHVAGLRNRKQCKDISFPYNVPQKRFSTSKSGTSLRGHLHWIVERPEVGFNSQLIVCFDATTNQFSEFPMPMPEEEIPVDGDGKFYYGLTVFDGCLCVSCCKNNSVLDGGCGCDVFITRDYGVKESWSKLFSIRGILVPLNFRNSSELVLVAKGNYLYTYNLRNECLRFIAVQPPDPSPHESTPNLRKKCPLIPLYLDDCPLVYVESLAPVQWPEQ